MGTRCLTHIKDSDCGSCTLVTIYTQFDGYPDGWGLELQNFLKGMQICNGFGLKQKTGKWANGSGCLAAQLIAHTKEGIGNIYIYPAGMDGVGEEFVYTIYFVGSEDAAVIHIRCDDVCDSRTLYDGPVSEWDISKLEDFYA
jgi:hypothetical protein